jgi:hypothetical protein
MENLICAKKKKHKPEKSKLEQTIPSQRILQLSCLVALTSESPDISHA